MTKFKAGNSGAKRMTPLELKVLDLKREAAKLKKVAKAASHSKEYAAATSAIRARLDVLARIDELMNTPTPPTVANADGNPGVEPMSNASFDDLMITLFARTDAEKSPDDRLEEIRVTLYLCVKDLLPESDVKRACDFRLIAPPKSPAAPRSRRSVN